MEPQDVAARARILIDTVEAKVNQIDGLLTTVVLKAAPVVDAITTGLAEARSVLDENFPQTTAQDDEAPVDKKEFLAKEYARIYPEGDFGPKYIRNYWSQVTVNNEYVKWLNHEDLWRNR